MRDWSFLILYFQESKFAVLLLGFEELGLEFVTIVDEKPKTTTVASIPFIGSLHLYSMVLPSIDYRCEDGRFPVSQCPTSCVTTSKPNPRSSSETED